MTMLAGVGGAFLVALRAARSSWGSCWPAPSPAASTPSRGGTERLRQGDFAQPIPVQSRDQLGELADSFNVMARGIQELLRE